MQSFASAKASSHCIRYKLGTEKRCFFLKGFRQNKQCRGRESNSPRKDFQSFALPTELPRHLCLPFTGLVFLSKIMTGSNFLPLAAPTVVGDWIQSFALPTELPRHLKAAAKAVAKYLYNVENYSIEAYLGKRILKFRLFFHVALNKAFVILDSLAGFA